ncbi:histidine phosphatase family protein [bacterium]|nr:histidine phosphatase family protein [bacterium]
MQIIFFRHGIAIDRDDPACPLDPDRFLTDEGRMRTDAAARGLAFLVDEVDLAITSPYVRARQTIEIALEHVRAPRGGLRESDALLPEAHPAGILRELTREKANRVLLAGHAPGLDYVIALALDAPRAVTSLKKAGAACVEWEAGSPGGTLLWLMRAKDLMALGKR